MSEAAKTPMADRIQHFWNAISEPHVRILVDMRRDHEDGSFHWDSSSFSDDVAKALVGSRASAPSTRMPDASKVLLTGRMMANAMYNLSQRGEMTDDIRSQMRIMQQEWDKAAAEYRATATPSTAMTAGRCEDCPPVGYPTAKTRCAPCDRRSVADDMAASIRTAESMLSAHIEEFHDFDYQPHEVPAELQQLRSIQHHLLGSLIDETGEIYPSLSAPVAPAAPVAGAPDQWQDIAHEARFLLDRLEELDDANDKEYVREFEGHVRPPMSRLRRLLPRNERVTSQPDTGDKP